MTQADNLRRAEAAVIKAAEKWWDSRPEGLPVGKCKCHVCAISRSVIRLRKARGETK